MSIKSTHSCATYRLPFLKNIDLHNKRVFLRADLNSTSATAQDYRLNSILPTIDYIQKNNGKVILATHIGRPQAQTEKNFFDESLSTKQLLPWFAKLGYTIDYEIDLLKAIEKSKQATDTILLLENLRFFNGEQATNNEFAKLLAQCGDIYINDAFGVLHRNDTSITLLPQQFAQQHRAFGFLVEKEISTLQKLKEHPKQPFVAVLGGSKIATKLPLLENFLEQPTAQRVSTILLNGLLAQALLQAEPQFLEKAKRYNVDVILPVDVAVASKKLTAPATIQELSSLPADQWIVDIGPKTIELFRAKLKTAATIFANGTMGIYEQPEYATGSQKIFEAIAQSHAYSVIGGGDAVAATRQFGYTGKTTRNISRSMRAGRCET